MKLLPRSFFAPDAVTVARALVGKVIKKGACEGVIVEVEAYAGDAASHAVKKPQQGRLMRETTGHWYTYFTYGMHWCANVTCDAEGMGAVLIRAVAPTKGVARMQQRRGTDDILKLAKGPACFAQAFDIGKKENGLPLSREFGIFMPDTRTTIYGSARPADMVATPRIGISHAVELPWRFYVRDNPYVSKVARVKKT